MPKHAISVTLESANLTWLKGQAGATGVRSVSELLDRMVTQARETRKNFLDESLYLKSALERNTPVIPAVM